MKFAPVDQLDRSTAYGAVGWRFESSRAHFPVNTMTPKKHSPSRKLNSQRLSKSFVRSRSSSKKMFSERSHIGPPTPKGELDFFHHVVDQIGDEVMVSDSQARIVFVNEATVAGLGYTKKNILYRPVMDFFQERMSLRRWQKTYFEDIKRKKKPVSYIVKRVVKGKKIRTIEVTAVYMSYKSEGYVLTVGRDITQQLAFQDKLKASEDRYRILSEQAAEGILVINTQGTIVYANRMASDTFKVAPSKVIGRPFGDYIDKASLPKAMKCFQKVKGGQSSICNEVDIVNKNGKVIPSEFMGTPIFAGKKVVQAHVIFRNMSQRKEMERLVRESEKMKALQHFVAGMTREIQQPLKGLLDRSQSLIDKYEDRYFEYIGHKEFSDIMKTLRIMNDQMRYCFDTTDRMVSLSRKKAKLADRRCAVNAVIKESVNLLKHSLEVSDISLKVKLSSRLPPVAIGSLELSQAMNNILTNAIQSLPSGGGKIQIKTTYQKSIDSVRIDCHDDGIGIPKEVLDRVFEPFFTTKPRGLEKSSGLGLSIVYSIIKTHLGEVKIKSDFRKGTHVTILLPVYRQKKASKRK